MLFVLAILTGCNFDLHITARRPFRCENVVANIKVAGIFCSHTAEVLALTGTLALLLFKKYVFGTQGMANVRLHLSPCRQPRRVWDVRCTAGGTGKTRRLLSCHCTTGATAQSKTGFPCVMLLSTVDLLWPSSSQGQRALTMCLFSATIKWK